MVGAFLGAILIELLDQSLGRADIVSEFWRNAILGLLILGAVLADVAIGRRFRRRWARKAEAAVRHDDVVPVTDLAVMTDDDNDKADPEADTAEVSSNA